MTVYGEPALPDLTAVILAGGRGTRIQAVHPDVPKPMIAVRGKPFLYWVTTFLARAGVRSFIYSTGYLSEQIEAWCLDGSFPALLRRSRPEETPLGTGGGLLNCLDLCAEWVLVANGDGLCLSGVAELMSMRHEPRLDGGLVGVRVEDTTPYGSLEVDAEGLLTAFREKVPGSGYVNGGTYIFRRSVLQAMARPGPQSLERDIIPAMIAGGARLRPVLFDAAPFIDIGLPETLARAADFISRHIDPALHGS